MTLKGSHKVRPAAFFAFSHKSRFSPTFRDPCGFSSGFRLRLTAAFFPSDGRAKPHFGKLPPLTDVVMVTCCSFFILLSLAFFRVSLCFPFRGRGIVTSTDSCKGIFPLAVYFFFFFLFLCRFCGSPPFFAAQLPAGALLMNR